MSSTSTTEKLRAPRARVRLLDARNSSKAFEIRDFLSRSVVSYDWVELDESTVREVPGVSGLDDPRLPIAEFPDGARLFSATVKDIATRLGWVTKPALSEYDVSIYGAGPAGLSAAVYAASEGLKTVLIERHAVGGQAASSSLIENYMGFPEGISGADLAERARQQAVRFGAEILHMREGVSATFLDGKIVVDMADGTRLRAKTNICATGIEWRRLNIPGEQQFLGAGLYYGAGGSEAPMCLNENVYVVGGGNSAGQAAVNLAQYAREVVVLVRGANLADTLSDYLVKKIASTPNIRVVTNCEIISLRGTISLQEITVRDRVTGSEEPLKTTRVFVCIGGKPHTEWARDTAIVRDSVGYLVTGHDLLEGGKPPSSWSLSRLPYDLETSVPGSYAVGDVRHGSVKRVASAAGEGAMAVSYIHRHLADTH